MFSGEVSHRACQRERNAAERTGAGTGFGENGGSAEAAVSGQCPEVDTGDPARAQRSGSRGERRSSEMSEPCRMRQGEGYGACDDEGRVQGDNACSGVQRVKPLAQVGLMLASILPGFIIWRRALRFGGFATLWLLPENRKTKGGLIAEKEDVMAALNAGVMAVSTTDQHVWRM